MHGKLAVLFPGQGSQYAGMLRDLACVFPAMRDVLADGNRVFARMTGGDESERLSDSIYPHPAFSKEERDRQEQHLRRTEVAQPAIGAVSLGALKVLEQFGVQPDAYAGHSYGELPALCAAGCFDAESLHTISRLRGHLMASYRGADAGSMLAVSCSLEHDRGGLEGRGARIGRGQSQCTEPIGPIRPASGNRTGDRLFRSPPGSSHVVEGRGRFSFSIGRGRQKTLWRGAREGQIRRLERSGVRQHFRAALTE